MTSATTIEVEVRLNMGDLYRAYCRALLRKLWFLPAVILALFIVLQVLLIFSPGGTRDVERNARPLYYVLGAFCFVIFVSPYFSARSTLRNSKTLQGTIRYVFSENGMDVVAPGASGHNDWSTIHRVVETPRALMIYPSKSIMCLVPKRSFADYGSFATVRQLIRTHVSGKVSLYE